LAEVVVSRELVQIILKRIVRLKLATARLTVHVWFLMLGSELMAG
jgi:hypothetical protein